MINKKAAFIAICGTPNVGKSTLVNQIIGSKLSIVSPKVQTTRTSLKAIYNSKETQLIFVDTPGIFTPKKPLEEAIVKTAWSGLQGIDIILLIIDAVRGLDDDTKLIMQKLKSKKTKPILLINKSDLITKEKLERITKEFIKQDEFAAVFSISALNNTGIYDVLDYLTAISPTSPWYFNDDYLTTTPLRLLASEITREKLFLHLTDELPYSLTVETETWEEKKDSSIKINQVIFVTKESHKQIILGQDGKMIKKIGILAREDIEKLTESKVHLFLFVKVRESWTTDPERYKYLEMQQPNKKKKN